jgi:hypothetical protein
MIGITDRHAAIKRDELGCVRQQREADYGKSANHAQRWFPDSRGHWALCVENPRQPQRSLAGSVDSGLGHRPSFVR